MASAGAAGPGGSARDPGTSCREARLAHECPTFAMCKRYLDSLGLVEGTLDDAHDTCWCIASDCAKRHPNKAQRGSSVYGAHDTAAFCFGIGIAAAVAHLCISYRLLSTAGSDVLCILITSSNFHRHRRPRPAIAACAGLPKGWCGFGLDIDDGEFARRRVFQEWHMAFHGTTVVRQPFLS